MGLPTGCGRTTALDSRPDCVGMPGHGSRRTTVARAAPGRVRAWACQTTAVATSWIGARIATALVAALAVLSVGGLFTIAAVNAFVLEKFDAYGEMPIPGASTVYLPAGAVSVNFHVRASGRGTAVPPLTMDITPPPGGADPEVVDDLGGSVTRGDDVHRRVWRMQVPAEGGYRVEVDGPVGGFTEPRLAFGSTGTDDGLLWVFVALSIVSVDLAIAVWWWRRRARREAGPAPESGPYTPTDQGVRLEQLKTIAALRDSGALTEEEYEAEKRRILDGR